MDNVKIAAADILRFQVERNIKNTYKEALILLEELRMEHKGTLERLRDALPNEFKSLVDVADYWSPDKVDSVRKRILTAGNNANRNVQEQMDNFDIRTL